MPAQNFAGFIKMLITKFIHEFPVVGPACHLFPFRLPDLFLGKRQDLFPLPELAVPVPVQVFQRSVTFFQKPAEFFHAVVGKTEIDRGSGSGKGDLIAIIVNDGAVRMAEFSLPRQFFIIGGHPLLIGKTIPPDQIFLIPGLQIFLVGKILTPDLAQGPHSGFEIPQQDRVEAPVVEKDVQTDGFAVNISEPPHAEETVRSVPVNDRTDLVVIPGHQFFRRPGIEPCPVEIHLMTRFVQKTDTDPGVA